MTNLHTDEMAPDEIERRMESGLRRALATPHKPHTASKGKRAESSQSK